MAAYIPAKGEPVMTFNSNVLMDKNNLSLVHSPLHFSRYSLLLIFAALCAIFTISFSNNANADLLNCAALRHAAPFQFLGPLVGCFTAPDPDMHPTDKFGTKYGTPPTTTGMIPAAAIKFMNNIKTYFYPAASAMAVFMLSWFGLKLMAGDVQNLKGDSFSVLFKIAGVFFFLDEAPVIYNYLLVIMTSLNVIMSKAVNAVAGKVFCTGDLWQEFDCLMAVLAAAAGVGLLALVLLTAFTAGTGIVILFVFLYLVFTLFFTIVRFAQVYIMSVLALSLMFSLGYIFVPFMLFKNTFHYFQKWLAICLAYVLVPVIMYGYMAMMFVAMDTSIISGKYSIMNEFLGKADVSAMKPNDHANNPVKRIHCPSNGQGNNGVGCNNHAHTVVYLGNDDVTNATNTNVDAGTVGQMQDNGVQAKQYKSMYHASQNEMAFHSYGVDSQDIARNQGEGKTPQQLLFDIVISIFVAALLTYIMYSLLSYIPDLASDLVSQGTSAGKNVVKAEVFGEAVVKFALELAKEAALAVATGGASAGEYATRKGVEAAAKVAEKAAEEGAGAVEGKK